MTIPEELERRHTLATATARYNELRMRDAVTNVSPDTGTPQLNLAEILEMLALGEVMIRKVGYGRQAMVRSARLAGASWTQIGAALGSSKQAAWEAHQRWIDDQARENG
ncbi:hypothetical protein AB0F81_11570 [Actinoplanes sp. NPDC024001]|uniref:hypothetical protein n=1 Tax=Actinoplanes sp. NPDC024001 TaxID=3154598 RepID=UPI0033DDC4D8